MTSKNIFILISYIMPLISQAKMQFVIGIIAINAKEWNHICKHLATVTIVKGFVTVFDAKVWIY